MLRSVRDRFLYAGLGALALVLTVPFLPQSFLERMGTITKLPGRRERLDPGRRCGCGRSTT